MTNCYLLKTASGFLLIDCGNENDRKTFLNKLKQLHISLKDINYLLITHHHNDHCGLLNFITSENPAIKVIMSSKCAGFNSGKTLS
jgi:glyoxylase-like metal-dependent hydrolase (beta-lactamase superfamily II)